MGTSDPFVEAAKYISLAEQICDKLARRGMSEMIDALLN